MTRLRLHGAIIGLAIGLGCGPAAAAAEGFAPEDLRLTISILPSSQPVHIDYQAPTFNGSEEIAGLAPGARLDLGASLHLLPLGKRTSLILAVGVFTGQQEVAEDDNRLTPIVGPLKVGTQGLDVGLGLATRLGGGFHLEAVPFIGAAFAKLTDRGFSGNNPSVTSPQSGSGTSTEYGVRAAVYYTGDRNHLQVGLGVGYLVTRTEGKLQFDIASGGELSEKVTVDSRGLSPFLSFGYRF